jgi:hypothetical protein
MTRLAALMLALPLAACGGDGGNSNFSIHAEGKDGNVAIASDDGGHLSIKAPGIEGSVKFPKIDIDAADFQVDGVKLYPGSKIHDFNISAADRPAGDKDEGQVAIAFDSPAALDKVQGWFRDNMAQQGFKVTAKGTGFAGTTPDGGPVTLDLTAAGDERTTGTMVLGSK